MMPASSIAPPENRRVINFPNRELIKRICQSNKEDSKPVIVSRSFRIPESFHDRIRL